MPPESNGFVPAVPALAVPPESNGFVPAPPPVVVVPPLDDWLPVEVAPWSGQFSNVTTHPDDESNKTTTQSPLALGR